MKRFVEVDGDGNVICEINASGNTEEFSDESKYIDITDVEEDKRPRCGHKHTGGKNFTNPAKDIGAKRGKVNAMFESMVDNDILIDVSTQTKAKTVLTINSIEDHDKLNSLNGAFFRLLVEFIDENNGIPNQEEIDSLIKHSEKIIQVMIDRSN